MEASHIHLCQVKPLLHFLSVSLPALDSPLSPHVSFFFLLFGHQKYTYQRTSVSPSAFHTEKKTYN